MERMPAGKVDLLAAPEAPGADHEKAGHANDSHPRKRQPHVEDRVTLDQVDHGGKQASSRRDGHADKILAIGAAGILGQGIVRDVEASQPAGATDEEQKTEEATALDEARPHQVVHGERRQLAEAPGKREDAGSDAEGDDVGERVKFLAEVAGRVGHAGDAAVQRVEGNREQDGERSEIEMLRLQRRPLQTLRNGVIAGGNVAGSKE